MLVRAVLFFSLLIALNVSVLAQKATSNSEPIKVGAIAPDFNLSSNKGQITLSKIDKMTVLVFYRGYW